MSDLISREAVIDAIRVYANRYKEHIGKPNDSEVYAHSRGLIVSIEMSINALPSAEPKWIPVTERLPEEDGRYLVFRQKNGKIFIDGWMVGRGWLFFETIDAWMPLPEPYEEEGE